MGRKKSVWERICWWIAFHLPKRITAYAAYRVLLYATSGKYAPQTRFGVEPGLEAYRRWAGQYTKEGQEIT